MSERYVSSDVIIRFFRIHNIKYLGCASCFSEEEYGISLPEHELGKGRWTYADCAMLIAFDDYAEKYL